MNKTLKFCLFFLLFIIIITEGYYGYHQYKLNKDLSNDIIIQNQQQNQKETISDMQTSTYTSNTKISELTNQLQEKETLLQKKETLLQENKDKFEKYDNYIKKQDEQINQLQQDINILKRKLKNVSLLYENAKLEIEQVKPIVERYERGINLKKYHTLLGDYEDYAQPLMLKYLNLDEPTAPQTDIELWERGKKIYNWISARYTYCGDRGLRFGNIYTEFQFFSPDELMSVDNHWCGDCDDFATLFAGLMYASGVSHSKVYVVCGKADGGGHCWNWFNVGGKIRNIDTVCTQSKSVIDVLGYKLWEKDKYEYPENFANVDCFDKYQPLFMMTPENFAKLNVSYE